MKVQAIGLVVILQTLLAACAHAPTAVDDNHVGNRYYDEGNYQAALAKYRSALTLAQGGKDQQYEAIAMFGIARAHAHLCQVQEAETWFKRSIAARRNLPNLEVAYLTQNLLEYARFLRARSRYKEAVGLYEEAMPALDSLGVETRDPMGFVLVLKEYEALLQAVGRSADAQSIATKAATIEAQNQGQKPKFTPEAFPKC